MPIKKAVYETPRPWEKKFEEEIKYWQEQPWEKKWNDPNYIKFEQGRSKMQRAEIQAKIKKEKEANYKSAVSKSESELAKPWGQRERNKGIANKVFWRPLGLFLDIAALPFWFGSKIVGSIARPLSWANDRLFGNVGVIKRDNRSLVQEGTTKKDFLPSVFAERRKLAEVKKKGP